MEINFSVLINSIWEGCADGAIRLLEIQQNYVVRICLHKIELNNSTTPNYKELKMLKL